MSLVSLFWPKLKPPCRYMRNPSLFSGMVVGIISGGLIVVTAVFLLGAYCVRTKALERRVKVRPGWLLAVCRPSTLMLWRGLLAAGKWTNLASTQTR